MNRSEAISIGVKPHRRVLRSRSHHPAHNRRLLSRGARMNLAPQHQLESRYGKNLVGQALVHVFNPAQPSVTLFHRLPQCHELARLT